MADKAQNIISKYSEPSIRLDEVAIRDVESDDAQPAVSEDSVKPSKTVGHFAPYVKINGYVFDHHDILDMTLREVGFLPTLTISLRDTNGVFKSAYFPKTDPSLSLYIRSKHDKLKCIRCDFIITDIYSMSSLDKDNHSGASNIDFTINGIMLVPLIYQNVPSSYAGMTSMETLFKVASEIGLGFATNESSTNDGMTWVKPVIDTETFIKHVASRAFKDDNSFYTCFIDRHYHLTFVNVASMFENTGGFDKLYERMLDYADVYTRSSDDPLANDSYDFVLTNYSKMGTSDAFVAEYRPVASQGRILVNSGYIYSVSYYDQLLDKDPRSNFVTLDIRPKSDSMLPGGPEGSEKFKAFSSNIKYKAWYGTDYNNAHDNYNYALMHNRHNNMEIRKVTMYARLDGINLNIVRGMRVPLVILRENLREEVDFDGMLPDEDVPKADTERGPADTSFVMDKWLSGYYVVGDITFTYSTSAGFNTELTLLRLEWEADEAKMPSKKVQQ